MKMLPYGYLILAKQYFAGSRSQFQQANVKGGIKFHD